MTVERNYTRIAYFIAYAYGSILADCVQAIAQASSRPGLRSADTCI